MARSTVFIGGAALYRQTRYGVIACRVGLIAALVFLALMALMPPLFAASDEAPPVASQARVAGDETRTRFVMDFDKSLHAVAFPLADPWRIVVDLPEVAFQLPQGSGESGHGLVTGWRYGAIGAGKSRLVIDTRGPTAVDKIVVMDPVDQQPARLVIDLVPQTPAEFAAGRQQAMLDRPAGADATPAASPPVTASPVTAPPVTLPLVRHRPVVVIDPGHGGQDSGAIGISGVMEKDIVLSVARAVRDVLIAEGKADVFLTRDADVFITLEDRVRFAEAHKADLFLSIHADSIVGQAGDVRGATVYTLSEKASDQDAARVAETENAADAVGGVQLPDKKGEIGDILLDLARRETKNFSLAFARGLEQELSTTTRLNKTPRRSAGFRVLRAMNIPSALVELGYLSHPLDEKLLTTPDWQQRMAQAVARSVDVYFIKSGLATK